MQVGIVLGSRSQCSTMKHTERLLAQLGIHYESRIITTNKGPNPLHEYTSKAINRGLEIIIAGSTEKKYLPAIIASKTELPILGVQIDTSSTKNNISDSNSDTNKYDQIRMFNAGPNGAVNAALFAASLLANKHPHIRKNLIKYLRQNEYEEFLWEKYPRYCLIAN